MTTIKYRNQFWNYDRVSEITFGTYGMTNGVGYMASIWHNGKYAEVTFPNKEAYDYAQKKLEDGLISNYVLIDLENYDA